MNVTFAPDCKITATLSSAPDETTERFQAQKWALSHGVLRLTDDAAITLYRAYLARRNERTEKLYARLEPWGA